jgi:SEC-C motif domain protein
MPANCPCCSGNPYSDCCEPRLNGTLPAPTAEALMRSRYTAFTRGNIDYLIATLHPKSRRPDDKRRHRQTINQTQWIRLTVLKTQKGQASDKTGIVEFVAEFRDTQVMGFAAAEVKQLHERSRFVREQDQWFYVDGDVLPPVKLPPNRASLGGIGA